MLDWFERWKIRTNDGLWRNDFNNYLWFGADVKIMLGVSNKGNDVVNGAGTIVKKNTTEDYALICGSPARVLKSYKR